MKKSIPPETSPNSENGTNLTFSEKVDFIRIWTLLDFRISGLDCIRVLTLFEYLLFTIEEFTVLYK